MFKSSKAIWFQKIYLQYFITYTTYWNPNNSFTLQFIFSISFPNHKNNTIFFSFYYKVIIPCVTSQCFEKLASTVKNLLQILQKKGLITCSLLCFIQLPLSLNFLLHTSQEYGVSPVCTRRCLLRCHFFLKGLKHSGQEYLLLSDGSGVCIRKYPSNTRCLDVVRLKAK